MSMCQKRAARRLSVWLLIFSILVLTAAATLPTHATPAKDNAGGIVRDAENAGNAVGDVARDAADGARDIVKDAADGVRDAADGMRNGEGGKVTDGDGVIGNEANNAADATTGTQNRVGQIALIVVIVAVVIAIIIIVLLIPKKRKD